MKCSAVRFGADGRPDGLTILSRSAKLQFEVNGCCDWLGDTYRSAVGGFDLHAAPGGRCSHSHLPAVVSEFCGA